MSPPLGQIQKPEAERFKKGRKLYLVPLFMAPADPPRDLQDKLEAYWSGADEHIQRLEAALGPVNRIYHEMIFLAGDEGANLAKQLNPVGYELLRARREAGAELEPTEDQSLVMESSDWQRCMAVGLMTEKASTTVIEAYREVTNGRYQYIADRINETLKGDESAILFIGDDHRVQFPADIQVFYIAPPALDELRRWTPERPMAEELESAEAAAESG